MKRFGICLLFALLFFTPVVRAQIPTYNDVKVTGSSIPTGDLTTDPVCINPSPFPNHCFVASQTGSVVSIWNFDALHGNAVAYPLTPAFGTNPFVNGLTADRKGNVWFTVSSSAGSSVGKLAPGGAMNRFAAGLSQTAFVGASHIGMAQGPDDRIYATEPAFNKICGVDDEGHFIEYSNPNPAQLQDLAFGLDGNAYATDFAGSIEQMTTGGVFTKKMVPLLGSALSHPGFMARNADGRIFCTDRGQNTIDEIDPSESFNVIAHPIPTPNSGPAGIAQGQDANIYFNEGNTGKLGQFNTTSGLVTDKSGLPSLPILYLARNSEVSSGSVDSLLAVNAFEPAGEQLSIIDITPAFPCPPDPPLSISFTEPHQTCHVGKSCQENIAAQIGGGAPPYRLSAASGLPPGLGTGSLGIGPSGYSTAGVPTKEGTYTITVTFVDQNGCPVTGTYVMTVLPATGPPCKQGGLENLADLCMFVLAGAGSSVHADSAASGARSPAAAPDPTDYRFWLSLFAVDPRTGNIGVAQAIPQKATFGYFSFPSFTNDATFPEVMVKIVDGRAISCCFWLFHTGLTDLQYTLTVFDTITGNYKQYHNDRSDPSKLCGAADTQFFDGVTPGPASLPALPVLPESDLLSADVRLKPESFAENRSHPAAAASCSPNDSTVCLLSNRFAATLTAHDPRTGHDGAGVAIPQKDGFGYFSLPTFTFDATFPEVFVKMVDGRALNNSFWVFHSGLTDLEYTLTITDTTNGAVQVFHNDRSDPSKLCGAADTSAFH